MYLMHPGRSLWLPPSLVLSPDNEGGTPAPAAPPSSSSSEPAAADGNGTGDSPQRTFTQDDLDRLLGERAKRAEQSAVNNLLGKLNFGSPEELEQFLTEAREKNDAELSEIDRLKKALETAPKADQVQELQDRLKEYDRVIADRVKSLTKDLNIPEHFLTLLNNMPTLEQLDYINQNKDAFKPTPPAPNTNGGDKGKSESGKNQKAAVNRKYGIRRIGRSN